jgi:hypothetical protein
MGASSSVSVIRYINNCYNYKHIKNRNNISSHGEQQEYNSIININDNTVLMITTNTRRKQSSSSSLANQHLILNDCFLINLI